MPWKNKILSFEALLLFLLTSALVRVITLADLVAPKSPALIQSLPLVGPFFTAQRINLLSFWITDPLTYLLIACAFLLLVGYVVFDVIVNTTSRQLPPKSVYLIKLSLITGIVVSLVVMPTLLLCACRLMTVPEKFAHDGGVIQTEEAVKFILEGNNPYTADYTGTPLSRWRSDKNTAVYHFPYLPFAFLGPVPFYITAVKTLKFFDMRFFYLAVFVGMLLAALQLGKNFDDKLLLAMLLGLNPLMGLHVIYGTNDVCVFFLIVLAVYFLKREKAGWSALSLALACATKQTAWIFAPFYFLLLIREKEATRPAKKPLTAAAVFLLTFAALVVPFLWWNGRSFVDDVFGWSLGFAKESYPICGWGFSNFLLAIPLVYAKDDYFPFWIIQLFTFIPISLYLLRYQWRTNTIQIAVLSYAVALLVFLFFSRFIVENYLGYILSVLVLGYYI